MPRTRLHQLTRVVSVLRRPTASASLLAATTAVVATGAGWLEESWQRITALAAAALLALIGVVMAPRPRRPSGSSTTNMLSDDEPEFLDDDTLLRELVAEEKKLRATKDGRSGPRVILLHGKPGVGKSHLAYHLAMQVAKHYPDGQLYGRLGNTNDRSPAAILGRFLHALGVPQEEISKAQDKTRYHLFLTSTTNKRILMVLDGVHNIDQLNEVMPAEPNALVIVTSRQYLGDSRSHWVREPTAAAAEDILRSYAPPNAPGRPDRVAQIVEQCGYLPFALRAAGERALTESDGLNGVANKMADRSGRLAYLSPAGRDTTDRIASEYANLLAVERMAFRRLALVESATLVPWVLQPLLDRDHAEAGSVLARLRAAQLVDPVVRDPIGTTRYRLHPLFRLFAEQRLAAEERPADIEAARARLHRAYAAAAGTVLARLSPGFTPIIDCPVEHLPHGADWPEHVAKFSTAWVPTEYANLVGAVRAAHEAQDWGTCWRIAASLWDPPAPAEDHLIDPDRFRTSIGSVFELARQAAQEDSPTKGGVAVLLAQAMQLLAGENHDTTQALLTKSLSNGALSGRARATALRIKAQSMQMVSGHRAASDVLVDALAAANTAGDSEEQSRIQFLQKVNDCVLRPEDWKEVTTFQRAAETDSAVQVSALMWLAQGAARNGNGQLRKEYLDQAYQLTDLNVPGRALVLLAHADQELMNALVAPTPPDSPQLLVRLAGHAVWAHQVLRCPLGELHSRTVLTRALVLDRRDSDAETQLRQAQRVSQMLSGTRVPMLQANLHLAAGELGLYRKAASASGELRRAVELFDGAGDFWHAARARLALGVALGAREEYSAAFATLWQATTELGNCGDTAGAEAGCKQLETAHRVSGMPLSARHRRQLHVLACPP